MKKLFALLLCAALLLSLAACGTREEPAVTDVPETTATTTSVRVQATAALPFDGTESLNPFLTNSRTNLDLSYLLFDPLFKLDTAFVPVPVLATGQMTDDSAVLVSLRDDVRFTSGELLTARDVVYSFQCAKESPLLAKRLENIFSAAAEGDAVRFTLLSPDRFAANCLDFPVVKFGTGEADVPTGTGRYTHRQKNGVHSLLRNEASGTQEEMTLSRLTLFDLTDVANPLPLVQIGQLSCYLAQPDDTPTEKINANRQTVRLNQLVFCGLNSETSVLQDAAVKAAIKAAVDKTALADGAFSGLAASAQTPFHPAWQELSQLPDAPDYDPQKANELLENAGYVYASRSAKTRTKDGEPLTLRLLVNSENTARMAAAKLLQSQLAAVGIAVDVQDTDYNSYLLRLKNGGYDLYLGEVKLTANMDLSLFFSPDGGAHYGVDTTGSAAGAYSDYRSGSIDLSTFIKVFAQELPLLPLCFRNAQLYYTSELTYEGEVSENDLYGNLYSWSL